MFYLTPLRTPKPEEPLKWPKSGPLFTSEARKSYSTGGTSISSIRYSNLERMPGTHTIAAPLENPIHPGHTLSEQSSLSLHNSKKSQGRVLMLCRPRRKQSKNANPRSKGILRPKPYSHSGTQLYPSWVGAVPARIVGREAFYNTIFPGVLKMASKH